MRIYVDGDACPVAIMDIIQKAGIENDLRVLFVTSTAHIRNEEKARGYQFLIVDQEPEAVDLAIANQLEAGDLVVTQDYGLAALVLGKGAKAVTPYGLIFTDENIDSLLDWRYLSGVERRKGVRVRGGIKNLLPEQSLRFQEALEIVLKGEPRDSL
ncbi:MAG: DUF188 domain-containing protein [Bacillota bacterium]